MYLRASLAYFEPESEFELRSGDGLEEFIFAVYEIEKKKSGIDYLSLDDGNTNKGMNTYGNIEEISKFNKTQRLGTIQGMRNGSDQDDDYSESKGFETLWTVAEVSNEGCDSDSIDEEEVLEDIEKGNVIKNKLERSLNLRYKDGIYTPDTDKILDKTR